MPAVATQTGWSWLQDLREIEALAEASNVDFKQLSGFSSISDFTGKYIVYVYTRMMSRKITTMIIQDLSVPIIASPVIVEGSWSFIVTCV